MRIVHVIDTINPAHGGPPAVAENLAKVQAAQGHDVHLAVQTGPESKFVPTITLPRHSALQLFRRPHPRVTELVGRAEIIHLHGIWEPLLTAAARAARTIGRPYVITPHGMLDPWSLAQRKWKKTLALAIGLRRMLDRASALLALNQDEKRLLAPFQLKSPIEVIPNGIFLDDLDPPPDPQLFRSRKLGPGNRPYILFLGRLHYKKGLDVLALAFRSFAVKHPLIDLVIAGPDAGEEQPIRERIAQAGLTNRTWITGPLYGAEKWPALAGASIFCLPSRQEGFSIAILEAMACRVPVVITEGCNFPEVAEVGAGRIVRLDPAALEAALDAVLTDSVGGNVMGLAGRALVEQRYTWVKVAAKIAALYERLLKTNAAR